MITIDFEKAMYITPGMIVEGMPNEVYHSIDGFYSSSQLKKPTPIHMLDKTPVNDGIKAGTVFHKMMEGKTFLSMDNYDSRSKQPVIDYCLKYGKDCHKPTDKMKLADLKILAELIKAEYAGDKPVIDRNTHDNCSAMVKL